MNFFLPYAIRGEERWTYHEKNETTLLDGIFGVCQTKKRRKEAIQFWCVIYM